MTSFQKPVVLRWADFDANFHLRHSVYYDLGAALRVDFLQSCGVTMELMQQHGFGPVLFREEAVFRREVRPGDELTINLLITRLRRDHSRFSFRHEIVRADGTLCAVLNIDGAWIDTQKRKLTPPPDFVAAGLDLGPRAEDFEWVG
jgi:acyl-CoA thioester hydrolase